METQIFSVTSPCEGRWKKGGIALKRGHFRNIIFKADLQKPNTVNIDRNG